MADLSGFPPITFSDVEAYAKAKTGCTSIPKAYKFFAEPGYFHDLSGKVYTYLT